MATSTYHPLECEEEGLEDDSRPAHVPSRHYQLPPFTLAAGLGALFVTIGFITLVVTAVVLATVKFSSTEQTTRTRHRPATVMLLTGFEQFEGLGDFVKGLSSAVLIAEIMNSTFYSVAGVSEHGYSASKMMGVDMDNRTLENFEGGVCDVNDFLKPEIRSKLSKSCSVEGEVTRQEIRTALAGCGVMIMNVNTKADDYQNYKCMFPWIKKHLPPGEPPLALQAAWTGSTNRILVHYRYGDLATLDYLSGKQTSIQEVNEFLDGVQRFSGNSTVIIIAEDYPETTLRGVTSAHQVFNDSTIVESFWLAEHSTHLFTSESGFSQLLRIAANLSAPSFVPNRLYHMNENGQVDTVAALPLSAMGLLPRRRGNSK